MQRQYSRALVRLFRSYRQKVLEVLRETAKPVPGMSAATLQAAEVDIIAFEPILRQLGVQLTTEGLKVVVDNVRKTYAAGTMYGVLALRQLGIEMSVDQLPADWRAIDALKVRNLSALRGITDETGKEIIRELTEGMQVGESVPKLAARIKGRVDHIGITRAMIMARTEAINAFTQGAEQRYAQAGIENVEWIVAWDDRLCDQCAPLDGKVFELKGRHVRPPLHPQCRCSILPVVE